MIHYHGTPITPRRILYEMAGKHFCVSFFAPRDAEACLQIGQSVMFDNGAFSFYTAKQKGRLIEFDPAAYFAWLENKLCPPHWAIIPDIIDGELEDNLDAIKDWPWPKHVSAPVWHLHEPIDHLLRLLDEWTRVCFGSSGKYWQVGSEAWEKRMDEAWDAIALRHPILPWIHMLRGLDMGGRRWPFSSADSTNVALHHHHSASAKFLADGIDARQTPTLWIPRNREQFSLEV